MAIKVGDVAFRRRLYKYAFRGFVGVSVATPVIAIFQGQHLLSEFRKNHRDAPFPAMPCSGVVVVHPQSSQISVQDDNDTDSGSGSEKIQSRNITGPQSRPTTTAVAAATAAAVAQKSSSSSSWFSSFPLLREQKEPDPLRLLVVGDSLAAGVGVTKSGTPVLPEAIAKSLSRALGGRAVYWTCMGEPGLSSPQIVKELLLAEKDHNNSNNNNDSTQSTPPIDVMDELKDWWRERRKLQQQQQAESDEQLTLPGKKSPETTEKIRRWWKKTQQNVETDFKEFRDKIHWRNLGDTVKGKLDMKIPELLPLRRRNADVPDLVAQYDVAVVITGFNDLKNLIFPLPPDPNDAGSTSNSSSTNLNDNDELSSNAWFERDLFTIMRVLRGKMRNYGMNLENNSDDDNDANHEVHSLQENSSHSHSSDHSSVASLRRHHPMVVFPATPIFAEKIYPLSLFADPIVALMDYQKKKLAEKYPAPVLFLNAPRNKVITDYLNKRGPLWEARSKEEVLFELTNKARLENLEHLMKEYYQTWTVDVEEESPTYTYDMFGPDIQGPMQKIERSPLISPDNIHPSDEGYELWGRHIAEAIVEEWDRDGRPRRIDEAGTDRCTENNFDGGH